MKTLINAFFYVVLGVNTTAYAEVMTDGTVGAVQHLSGQMAISQDLGTLKGANLFHSFKTFNINTGETATFTGSDTIKNVISRVTGGQFSTIDGLLKSEVGQANFYFINPAGVTFGSHAEVNVPAAFHVSTANSLKFADGSSFNATNPTSSTLSIAEPVNFGFLNNQLGDIKIQGSSLSFLAANLVSFSGSNIMIDNGTLANSDGQTHLYGVGSKTTEIGLNAPPTNALSGNITISNNSAMDVSGFNTGAGQILMRADSLTIKNSKLTLDNFTDNNPVVESGLNIVANDVLIDNSGLMGDNRLMANSYGQGKGAGINITSNNLSLVNSGKIETGSYGSGDAGLINLTVNHLQLLSGGQIITSGFDVGKPSEIRINAADSILIDGQNAPADALTGILAKTTFLAQTESNQNNNATDRITLPIYLKTAHLQLTNHGLISNETFGSDNLGEININAKTIIVEKGADITSRVICSFSDCFANGNAGKITLNADNLTVQGGGQIISSTFDRGNAGDIVINAHNVLVDGQGLAEGTGIGAQAAKASTGQVGNIMINTDEMSVMRNGTVSISSFANVSEEQLKAITPAKLFINAHNLKLTDNGNLYAAATGNVPASPIVIQADLLNIDNSSMSTDAKNADGGAITLNGTKTLIHNGQITTSVTNQGNGGDININSKLLILDGGFIQANTAGIGNVGGDININVENLIASHNQLQVGGNERLSFRPDFNVIQAASPLGVNGNINIRNPIFNISGSISGLSSASLMLPTVVDNSCDIGELNSSLVWGGKGGMPVNDTTNFIPSALK